MKKLYLFAVLAAMLAACSENDLTAEKQVVQQNAEEGAVLFDSYVNRPTTRSGQNGTITNATDNFRHLKDVGFGVFGFYTDDNDYDGQSLPNFMYNEYLHYDGGTGGTEKWIYDPVKYWPNEYGNSAIADDADKVSFFAYAPYVKVTPNTGKAEDQTYGITQLSRNSLTGDPYVKYIASFDWTKNVDLLWGVCDDPSWAIVAGENQQINDGAKGLPWLNVQRPKEAGTQATQTDNRVKFNFKHALSQLNVVVDYDADQITHPATSPNELDATTRVYVRSVTFTGFSTKGTLNLNNTEQNTPLWMNYDGISDLDTGEETTIYDGRKDGKEGSSSASNEQNAFLNPALIQTTTWNNDNKGVQNVPQNLFYYPGAELVTADMLKGDDADGTVIISDEACIAYGIANGGAKAYSNVKGGVPHILKTLGEKILNWPVMVIPNGDEVTVTIVYDVETIDKKLATTVSDNSTKGSSIENRITKTITFNSAKAERNYMEAGKKYTIQLHLGLNSVKFDAEVSAWNTDAVQGENWFPANTPTYQAPGVYDYTVAADATKFGAFTINGFSPKEALTVTIPSTAPSTTGAITNSTSLANVGATGSAEIADNKITWVNANTSVLNVTTPNVVKFTGVTSGKELTLNLVQLAAQPKVNNPSDANSSTLAIIKTESKGTFTLRDGASATALTGAIWTGATRNVTIVSAYRNGYAMTELDEADDISGGTALQFCCNNADGKNGEIILGKPAQVGEVFIFTIKAGDSGEVTITCKVAE